MRLIGLTGRSGTGKSTVGACAKELGMLVLDCDAVYAELTGHPSDCLDAICNAFGENAVQDGALCRPFVRELVFRDADAMQTLHAITAEYMTKQIDRLLAESDASFALLDAPTLFECGMDETCDCLLCVIASDANCVQRICARDGITPEAASARLAQQHPNAFFVAQCDYVLYNEGDEAAFRADAIALLQTIMRREELS